MSTACDPWYNRRTKSQLSACIIGLPSAREGIASQIVENGTTKPKCVLSATTVAYCVGESECLVVQLEKCLKTLLLLLILDVLVKDMYGLRPIYYVMEQARTEQEYIQFFSMLKER